MKIGFIGLGNMATAIIGGLIAKNFVKSEEIMGSAKSAATVEKKAKELQIMTTTNNCEVAEYADVLVLAVKPVFLENVLTQIKESIKKDALIISLAAGKSIQFFEERIGNDKKIVRCMPNTPALVMEGCTAICLNLNVTEEEKDFVEKFMSSFGKASIVEERLMDAVVGVSGSSPAYVYMFIEAMADAAVLGGMPRTQAYEFAAQSVLGSAKMVLETGKHPGELKDAVCSPGGTTIEAVKVLEEKGFRAAIMDAMLACMEKNKKL